MDRTIKTMLIAGVLSLYCVSASAVTVPNTFSANTPAVAAEVNENFSVLEDAINNAGGSVSVKERRVVDSSGAAKVTCLSTETVVSAGCYCTGSQAKGTNFGVVFACMTSNNSAIGGCFPYIGYKDSQSTPIQVTAVCVSNARSKESDSKLGDYVEEPVDLEADRAVEALRRQAEAVGAQVVSGE